MRRYQSLEKSTSQASISSNPHMPPTLVDIKKHMKLAHCCTEYGEHARKPCKKGHLLEDILFMLL